MSWYLSVLQNYADFSGRARRTEYWMFTLVNALISFALVVLDALFGTLDVEAGVGLFSTIYALAVLIPSLAVSVRRLHDTGRSGWWLLIAIIPLIGGIVLFVFTVMDSEPGRNDYGPYPKHELQLA
jgi:uncharacterized membrane protein YhaH (DUF805 family)